jgi:hypothetical protein
MIALRFPQRVTALLAILIWLTASCSSIRLISAYDEITDKAVTALQEKVSTFFIQMDSDIGTEQANYVHHEKFYQEAKVDLSTLRIRANAIEKNKIVQDQLKELNSMLLNLEALHKIGFASKEMLTPLRQPFESAFTAIIKLQLALKRGEKNKN